MSPSNVVTITLVEPFTLAVTVALAPVAVTVAIPSGTTENVTSLTVAFSGSTVAVNSTVSPTYNVPDSLSKETDSTFTLLGLSTTPIWCVKNTL